MKAWHALLVTAALGAAGWGAWYYRPRSPALPVAAAAPRASATADPNLLADPLAPEHPATLDHARNLAENWQKARPGFQASRKPAERGGVEPCATQKVDLSAFGEPLPLSKGRLTLPRELTLDADGRFELVMHLNGEEPVRRELALSGARLALYTLTIDPSQGYAPLFTGTGLFASLLGEIERAASKQTGRDARVGRVALSAWSAGFVGITAILSQPQSRDRVDAVLLIDGLHAPRGDRLAFEAQLAPFVAFAARASERQRFISGQPLVDRSAELRFHQRMRALPDRRSRRPADSGSAGRPLRPGAGRVVHARRVSRARLRRQRQGRPLRAARRASWRFRGARAALGCSDSVRPRPSAGTCQPGASPKSRAVATSGRKRTANHAHLTPWRFGTSAA